MKQYRNLIKPYLVWAFVVIVIPLILIALYAFTEDGNEVLTFSFTLENFRKFLEATYMSVIFKSFKLGILTTVICLGLGYPLAYIISKCPEKSQSLLILLVTIPEWINMLLAIGVSYLLQNVALLIWGADTKSFSNVISLPSLKLAGGSIVITGVTIVTIIGGILIMAGLMLFISKTKTGQAMLAVSEDKGAAQLMGINVNKTISITFAIGSGLAAIAGVLLCSAYPSLTPYTGAMPGIKAFVAAVFGGIGSIPGAFIGGVVLGILEIFGKAYISSQMADAIVFGVLIVVLVVKPTGILGKNIQEKV